jgi:hypothetical protein
VVPPRLVEPVPHVLLVEAGLRPPGLVLVGRPKARGVGRQDLIAEHDLGPGAGAELELGVREDDAALQGVRRRVLVELDRDPLELGEQGPRADDLCRAVEVDVLVVVADLRLGGRCEDRRRQLLGLLQAGGQLDPADRLIDLVLLPAGAGQVATDDALDRVHLEPLDPDPAAGDLLRHVLVEEVVRDDLAGRLEPEDRHLGEHLALVGNRVGEDHVVGADPVRGDHDQILVRVVDLADLAGGMELQR